MEPFFLNLAPAAQNGTTLMRVYFFLAVVFLLIGGYGVYHRYVEEGATTVGEYILPLIQLALAISYLFIAWRRRKPSGTRYVEVTDQYLELKLLPNQSALTLLWSNISLLRVQPDKMLYRLTSGQAGEISFDDLPEEHEELVRDTIRQAGRKKGVSL
ncbi:MULTISPECIES: hypothetical protein [Rufibacter]|uniref:Uncharacterized protein n=1 Tax=Rufibacter quisquiliarum TaxID=1549639 RepID=A0A839GUV5_9BACT|nr:MULTISPECIES: hypothetical protein [Rufibacter]MBA9079265.1 hypothetical protein [Rufibacter quisquiliarum]